MRQKRPFRHSRRRRAVPKERATFYLPADMLDDLRNAVVALRGAPQRFTMASIVEAGVRAEIQRLQGELNKGAPFPARSVEPYVGRPPKSPTRPERRGIESSGPAPLMNLARDRLRTRCCSSRRSERPSLRAQHRDGACGDRLRLRRRRPRTGWGRWGRRRLAHRARRWRRPRRRPSERRWTAPGLRSAAGRGIRRRERRHRGLHHLSGR